MHRIVYHLPELSCSCISSRFKPLSWWSLEKQHADCPSLAFQIGPASFAIFHVIYNRFATLQGWSLKSHDNSYSQQGIQFFGSSHIEYSCKHTLEGRSHDQPSWVGTNHCRFTIVVLDAAVQMQHISKYVVNVQSYWWYRAPFLCSDIFLCSDKVVSNTGEMLMEGNKGTFCVTLNNRESTSLDKVLLGNPINIVIPKLFPNMEPKPLSSIHQHHYLHFWCDRGLKYPPSGNVAQWFCWFVLSVYLFIFPTSWWTIW